MKRSYWIAGLSIVVLALVAVGAFVVGRQTHHEAHVSPIPASGTDSSAQVQGQTVMELARALEIAAQHVPGEVVKVELERDDGRFIYEVKVLAGNGRVREIVLDAHDGSLIDIEDD